MVRRPRYTHGLYRHAELCPASLIVMKFITQHRALCKHVGNLCQQGFAAFVDENLDAFGGCSARHGATECALYFESLGLPEEKVFFHADQVN